MSVLQAGRKIPEAEEEYRLTSDINSKGKRRRKRGR